jgi:Ca-activated chloride channel family protein
MDLLWPGFLLLLILIPLMIGVYMWGLRRRRRFVVRYSSLTLLAEAAPQQSWWRRHLPFSLLLMAVTGLVFALSRPVSVVSVPTVRANIILAMDVSLSMCSTDIPPNRLVAAQKAAMAFIERQASSTQVGIVAFAGYAELILPPTSDVEVLGDAVASLVAGRRTAIGSAIIESLDAISEIDQSVAPPTTRSSSGIVPTPVPRGAYAPSIIVLLTDGASNEGPDPLAAAQQAVARGVRVYTIGFGTAQGGRMDCRDAYATSDPFGGFGGGGFGYGGGGRYRRGIDEPTLQAIADMTGADYYAPESAAELNEVFRSLPTYLITKHETRELSVAFVAVGALLAGLAVALSLWWHPLV